MVNFNQHKISKHHRETKSWVLIISVVIFAHLIFFLLFKTEYLRVFERKDIGQGSAPPASYFLPGEGFQVVNTGGRSIPEARKPREVPQKTERAEQPIPLEYGGPPPGLPSLNGMVAAGQGNSRKDSVAGSVIKPKPLYISWPSYPENLDRKYQGQVKLSLLVNENGRVEDVRLLEGLPSDLLNTKALKAARDIIFVPGKKNGKNSPMWVQISIGFKQR